jgi:hypothetical protein
MSEERATYDPPPDGGSKANAPMYGAAPASDWARGLTHEVAARMLDAKIGDIASNWSYYLGETPPEWLAKDLARCRDLAREALRLAYDAGTEAGQEEALEILFLKAEQQSVHVGDSLARTPMLRLRCTCCGATTDNPGRLNAVCDACGDGVMVRGVPVQQEDDES